MKRGSVQAADRNAALHELAAQGLVPLSVTEGMGKASSTLFTTKLVVLVGGAVALLVGVLLVFQLLQKNTSGNIAKTTKEVQGVKHDKKTSVKKAQVDQISTNGTVFKNKKEEVTNQSLERKQKIALQQTATNLSLDVAITNVPPPMYTSQTEAYLHAIFNTQLGNPPPRYLPLPRKENIMAIVERDILINDTDTEDDIQQKAQVAQAKQILKEYLAKGGNKQDFVDFYYKELENANALRLEGLNQMRALYATGDEEGAMRYMEEQNKIFSEKGIILLKRPFTWDLK